MKSVKISGPYVPWVPDTFGCFWARVFDPHLSSLRAQMSTCPPGSTLLGKVSGAWCAGCCVGALGTSLLLSLLFLCINSALLLGGPWVYFGSTPPSESTLLTPITLEL